MAVSHSIPIHASLLFSYFKDHFSLCHVKAKHSFLLTHLTLTLCSTIDFVYMVNARQRNSIVPEPIDKSPYISPRGEKHCDIAGAKPASLKSPAAQAFS